MIRLVTQYADAMAERLEANDFKSGWYNLTPEKCLTRATQELGELRRALARGESVERIRQEAADVGNFLAFLVSNYADAMEMEHDAGGAASPAAAPPREEP